MNILPKFGDIWSNLEGSTSLSFTKQGNFTKFPDYQNFRNLTYNFGNFFDIFGAQVYLHGVCGTDDPPLDETKWNETLWKCSLRSEEHFHKVSALFDTFTTVNQ